MTQGDDSGRESSVRVRATVGEGRFAAMLRALAPAQVLSGDLRSVDNGRDGSGGLREVTAVERAIDRGEGARGRSAWQRVSIARGEGRRVLGWLITYARVGDLESLAVLYAANAAPVALLARRDLAETAHAAAAAAGARATTAHNAAKRIAQSRAPQAVADLIVAKLASDRAAGRLASCAAEVARVDAELRAWGLAAMGAAVEAWEDAGEECAA